LLRQSKAIGSRDASTGEKGLQEWFQPVRVISVLAYSMKS
jgi:hypothetical protein